MTCVEQQDRRRTACRRGVVALLAAVVALVALPTAAHAHAHLVRATPADGSTVDAPPTELVLEFSGTVVAGKGSIHVFSPDEGEAQRGKPSVSGPRVTQRLTSSAHGTYGVAYRVSSEDGHVITGTTSFVVV
jgi:methionine-rich copper-binding protein CopC